jgi:hypothetical protein
MLRETFDWLKPSPLWDGGIEDARRADFFQPQLLEFDDDNFIGAFRQVAAASDPAGLRARVCTATSAQPLKLFQPAHGRFYLVSATLSCRVPGLPERLVRLADGENVFFVVRRFVAGVEYGWVVNGTEKSWQPLGSDPRQVLDNEERQPLFNSRGADGRTIFVGYIPVASRDIYSVSVADLNSALSADEKAQFPNGIDLRVEDFEARFITAIKKYSSQLSAAPGISVYMVLDLWEFLNTNIPGVAAALRDNPASGFTGPQAAAELALMNFLSAQSVGGSPTLAAALGAVAKQQAALEAADDSSLATLGFSGYDLTSVDTDGLEAAVVAALPPDSAASIELPRQSGAVGETYAIRCVYERPQCVPPHRYVSPVSVPFQLANFFDADAPARPVRIVMPSDISLANMRKFQKGVTFMISASLQKKINMLTGHEKDILQPSPSLGSDSNGLAWMCSFSIQIIFIVAFFLLLMFVIILNICFWWIAFFRICIPIPKKLLPG